MRIALIALLVTVANTAAVATAQPAREPKEFDSFGVEFAHPAKWWMRIPERGTGNVARWARFGPGGKPDAVMTLELEPLHERSIEQYVATMAKEVGGAAQPVPTGVTFGGEPVTRITGGKLGAKAVESLVVRHAEYAYVIGGFADLHTQIPREAMETLARGLKFIPPTEPSAFTALRHERFPLFNRFVFQPLATMRPNPVPPPEKDTIGIGVVNYRAHGPDFVLEVQLIPNPNGVPMETFQQRFPGKLNPNQQATWTKLGDAPLASLSSTFDAIAGGHTTKSRIGIIILPPNNDLVTLFFSFANSDAKALSAYENASEAIARSVAPIKK